MFPAAVSRCVNRSIPANHRRRPDWMHFFGRGQEQNRVRVFVGIVGIQEVSNALARMSNSEALTQRTVTQFQVVGEKVS